MLSCLTVPDGLPEVVEALRGAFTAPSFATFKELVGGMLGAVGEHSVTGMWIAAGLAGRVHWSRAHRFFSHARWDPDTLGLLLARLVLQLFAPQGDLTVVVDDTLFHRYGRKVHAAFFQHDGSARGRDGLGRGNCFVVCAIVVNVPFMARAVALPVLFRLNLGKDTESKPDQARAMVGLLARAFPERRIHVVADALYRGPCWKLLPGNATFTTRLASNAALNEHPTPPTVKRRGHPAWKGPKLPPLAEIAAAATWRTAQAACYGKAAAVQIVELECLWWGSLHRTPAKLVLAREPGSRRPYDIALITTDLTATATEILERYSRRWSIEQTIRDCKILLGAGEARNRLRLAVERTVPFQMLCLTILFCWYQQAHATAGSAIAQARETRPWDRRKTHASVDDMLIAFRRHRISSVTTGQRASRQILAPQVSEGLAAA
jgi:hypothetical protein